MDMGDPGVSIGMNLALSFGSVVVKMQRDADAEESDIHEPLYSGDSSNITTIMGLRKVEKEDPGYGDTSNRTRTSHHIIKDVRSLAGLDQSQSEEQEASSEEESFIVMYNDDQRDQTQQSGEETGDQSGSSAVTSSRLERQGSNALSGGDRFVENDEEANNLSPLVMMVDSFLSNDDSERSGEINVTDSPRKSPACSETRMPSENGVLSDEQRSLDEIEVVEEDVDEYEEGEIIKEFGQNRHGTCSETFLSQMHFFGGRTWARGRGRRGHGRGRDITNIALKLIETDQMEADSEQSSSLDEVDQIKTVTDHVRSGRGKPCCRSGPAMPLRKSVRIPELKEAENSSPDVEHSRKESARGRGRPLGSRNKRFKKDQPKPDVLPAPDNTGDVEYESNDEDTLAAIRASLEDLNKNNNKTENGDNTNDDSSSSTEPKNDDSKADSTSGDDKTVGGSQKESGCKKDDKAKKKDDKTKQGETNKKVGKDKKSSSVKEPVKKVESNKKSDDQKKANKATSSKAQSAAKKQKGRALGSTTKQTNDIASNNSEPMEEVEYESNDEDTQAAIKASLEELEKEKQRQKERELGQQEMDEKQDKKGKMSKGKKSLTTPSKQMTGESSPGLNKKDPSVASTSRASTFKFRSRRRGKIFKKRGRYSARLAAEAKASNSTEKQAVNPGSEDASDLTQQKVKNISTKLKSRIQNTVVDCEEKEKRRSSDVSHFDSVVDEFLQGEKSPNDVSSDVGQKGKARQGTKRKSSPDNSNSGDVDVDSDNETLSVSSSTHRFQPELTPQVILQKLDSKLERSSSRGSLRSLSVASSSKKRLRDLSDDERDTGPSKSKVAKKSSDPPSHSGSSLHAESSVVDKGKEERKSFAGSSQEWESDNPLTEIISVLDTPGLGASHTKDDSLTKSVGGMMSYLFGDKLSEECPNGFVVNVRLEVEKKKDEEDGGSGNNSPGVCCKAKRPEQCACLQKIPDIRLASVLKERVENRRDLTVGAKGTLLAAILNFMQELKAASTSS